MAEPFTMDAGARYAFAPSPEPIEGVVHRIQVERDGVDTLTTSDMLLVLPPLWMRDFSTFCSH